MLLVAVYVAKRKDLGRQYAPWCHGTHEKWLALWVGSGIGLYDGFFGLGTGSVLIFLFVDFFGFDFLAASAVLKIVNAACDLSVLIWLGYSGHFLWQLGLLMAVCNFADSGIGTRMTLRCGSIFARHIFFVASLLILKTANDAFGG